MKKYKVKGCDSLDQWDWDRLTKARPDVDLVVYYYQNGGYDGSGVAVWRENGKWGYAYLGHCSCYGPLEDVNSILYTLPQLKKLAKGDKYEWGGYGERVIKRLTEVLEQEKQKNATTVRPS